MTGRKVRVWAESQGCAGKYIHQSCSTSDSNDLKHLWVLLWIFWASESITWLVRPGRPTTHRGKCMQSKNSVLFIADVKKIAMSSDLIFSQQGCSTCGKTFYARWGAHNLSFLMCFKVTILGHFLLILLSLISRAKVPLNRPEILPQEFSDQVQSDLTHSIATWSQQHSAGTWQDMTKNRPSSSASENDLRSTKLPKQTIRIANNSHK